MPGWPFAEKELYIFIIKFLKYYYCMRKVALLAPKWVAPFAPKWVALFAPK